MLAGSHSGTKSAMNSKVIQILTEDIILTHVEHSLRLLCAPLEKISSVVWSHVLACSEEISLIHCRRKCPHHSGLYYIISVPRSCSIFREIRVKTKLYMEGHRARNNANMTRRGMKACIVGITSPSTCYRPGDVCLTLQGGRKCCMSRE